MTRDEAAAKIKLLLGFRQDQTNTIITTMGQAQRELEDEWQEDPHPWFLITERSVTSTVANEERVEKPVDFLASAEEMGGGLFIINDDGCESQLTKQDEAVLRYNFPPPTDGSESFPTFYSEDGLYYRLFARPSAAWTLRQKYYQKDVELSEDGTNLWLTHYPNAIIGRTGLLLSGAGNNPRAELFAGLYANSLKAIVRKNYALLTNNRQFAMGENM